jgi:ATP-dependent RNA helicase DBP3
LFTKIRQQQTTNQNTSSECFAVTIPEKVLLVVNDMMFSSDDVRKTTKKLLKRNEGPIKLKELAKSVVSTLSNRDDSKVENDNNKKKIKQVKQIIQDETSIFQLDGKYVSLVKKNKKHKLIDTNDIEIDIKNIETNTNVVQKKTKLTTNTTIDDFTSWRKENKIVILDCRDDVDGKVQSGILQRDTKYFPWSTFDDVMGKINSALITHCTTTCKFIKPSPIQAQSWPILCAKRDMVGIAETGSGKTLAFALPALSTMADSTSQKSKRMPRMLVLSPTRELAMQSAAVLDEFGAVVSLRSLTIYGGVPKHPQVSSLREGHVDCLVATPGRIKDLIQEKSCNLSQIQYLILDEADRMLDMGFEEDVKYIISHCKHAQRQTAMFSATWPAAIQNIAMEYMKDPIRVYVGFESITGSNGDSNDALCGVDDSLSANKRVQQIVEVLDDRQRFGRLREVLNHVHSGTKKNDRVLVFALYKLEAERLEKDLQRDGWHCCSIHGNKNQQSRTSALSDFKDGTCPLLIATDVAARGLDIPNVECVINYTFPLTIEDYVHRIGRTGRAGKAGISYTFFQATDKSHAGELQQVLRQVGQSIPDDLAKFGSTIKKKEHKMYGNFGPKAGITKTATRITFTDDE